MIIIRQKSFSMKEEDLKRRIASPSNLKNLPIPIQRYYQLGINKDLYRLAQLQGTVATDYVVGPIPCPGEFTKEKDGKTYKSILGYSIDDIDLGKRIFGMMKMETYIKCPEYFLGLLSK